MKIIIPILFIIVLAACGVKKENPVEYIDKPSISRSDMKNTTSAVDTTYVEDPTTGDIQMILTKKNNNTRKTIGFKESKYPQNKKGDTIYAEDPVTGDIKMIIVK